MEYLWGTNDLEDEVHHLEMIELTNYFKTPPHQ